VLRAPLEPHLLFPKLPRSGKVCLQTQHGARFSPCGKPGAPLPLPSDTNTRLILMKVLLLLLLGHPASPRAGSASLTNLPAVLGLWLEMPPPRCRRLGRSGAGAVAGTGVSACWRGGIGSIPPWSPRSPRKPPWLQNCKSGAARGIWHKEYTGFRK